MTIIAEYLNGAASLSSTTVAIALLCTLSVLCVAVGIWLVFQPHDDIKRWSRIFLMRGILVPLPLYLPFLVAIVAGPERDINEQLLNQINSALTIFTPSVCILTLWPKVKMISSQYFNGKR